MNKSDITPNSESSELNAPARTAIAIIRNTVFKSNLLRNTLKNIKFLPYVI